VRIGVRATQFDPPLLPLHVQVVNSTPTHHSLQLTHIFVAELLLYGSRSFLVAKTCSFLFWLCSSSSSDSLTLFCSLRSHLSSSETISTFLSLTLLVRSVLSLTCYQSRSLIRWQDIIQQQSGQALWTLQQIHEQMVDVW